MKNVEALKALYVALGGSAADVANASESVDVLNAIAAKYEGDADADLNPEAIYNIAAVADNIGGGGGGGEGTPITVTLVSTNASAFFQYYGIVWDEELNQNVIPAVYKASPTKWANELMVEGVTNTEVDFLMFGESMPFSGNGGTLAVSGDAVIDSYDEEYGYNVTITGDCTLTMS